MTRNQKEIISQKGRNHHGKAPRPEDWKFHMERGDVTVRFRDESGGGSNGATPNVRNVIRAILTESYRARITVVGEPADGADLPGTKDIA